MLKRSFDLSFSLLGLFFLAFFFWIIAIAIRLNSSGSVLYRGERIGKNGRLFRILKFRSMVQNAEQKGLAITTAGDKRTTKVGEFLRKYKLDELPQLLNVFIGDMSFVGPRPEAAKYVALLSEIERTKILSVRPGITDWASLKYFNEEKILAQSADPEKLYMNEILPDKILLQLKYVEEQSFIVDIKIIFQTIRRILFGT